MKIQKQGMRAYNTKLFDNRCNLIHVFITAKNDLDLHI